MARTGRAFPQSTGTVAIYPWASNTPAAAQKWRGWKVLSTAGTNATIINNGSTLLGPITLVNTSGAKRYLKLFNATSLALGTDTPVLTLEIPDSGADVGLVWPSDNGITFSTGLAFALTTGAADNDTGAVGANEITGVICWY